MFIHRENALKAHQYNYIILFYTKRALKKKINTKSDENIHQDS